MTTNSDLRQRAAANKKESNESSSSSAAAAVASSTNKLPAKPSGESISVLDILRTLVGMILISTIASWLTTSGESYAWGYDKKPLPWWTTIAGWQRQFTAPVELTIDQLATYDGSGDDKRIYLAINRTIYDVSASPAVYGPGGFYAKLAAKDASRSYVTTCFDPEEDLVPYLGGVEEVFVPLWLSTRATTAEMEAYDDETGNNGLTALMEQVRDKLGRRKLRKLREEVYEEAKGSVRDKIANWENMFAKKGYPIVGKVVGVNDTDETKWKHLGFCADALKQRPAAADSLMKAVKISTGNDKIDISKMGGGASVNQALRKAKKDKKDKKKGGSRKDRAQQKKDEAAAAAAASKAAKEEAKIEPEVGGWENDPKANARVEDMIGEGKFASNKYPKDASGEDDKLPWEI